MAERYTPFRIPLTGMLLVFAVTSCSREQAAAPAVTLYERVVEGNVFDTTPVRGEFRPLRYRRSGFEYRCMECHADFESPAHLHSAPGEHGGIVLQHGLNADCLNCHHRTNRDAYVDYDGSEIAGDQPELLCRRCHGPTYRDWSIGIHGRQNGYWAASEGERTHVHCIQCHDPHNPAFKPMHPEPPPHWTRFVAKQVYPGEHP